MKGHDMPLKFSAANTKIKQLSDIKAIQPYLTGKKKIYSLSLLAGHSCPAADKCLARVIIVDGKRKIEDGENQEFRCFSASLEALRTNVYNRDKANFDAIRQLSDIISIANEIQSALPKNAGVVRIHVSGDFFNRNYFLAWVKVAKNNPSILFYAYTKQLPYWVENAHLIPPNMVLTASYGGKYDHMIEEHDLRSSIVVEDEEQAAMLGLEVDHDDSHAADPSKQFQSFALVIHGKQKKGRKKIVLPVLA